MAIRLCVEQSGLYDPIMSSLAAGNSIRPVFYHVKLCGSGGRARSTDPDQEVRSHTHSQLYISLQLQQPLDLMQLLCQHCNLNGTDCFRRR